MSNDELEVKKARLAELRAKVDLTPEELTELDELLAELGSEEEGEETETA